MTKILKFFGFVFFVLSVSILGAAVATITDAIILASFFGVLIALYEKTKNFYLLTNQK